MDVTQIETPVVAYQPYYIAYLIAHGYEDHHAAYAAHHGNHMAGNAAYMAWIHGEWRAYWAELGIPKAPGHQAAFGQWLLAKYPTPRTEP